MTMKISISVQQKQQDMQEARRLITQGVNNLVKCGCISCREDVIRTLIGDGFDITDITADNITICSLGEPDETLILSGYVFSERFQLSPSGRELSAVGEPQKKCAGDLSTDSGSTHSSLNSRKSSSFGMTFARLMRVLTRS